MKIKKKLHYRNKISQYIDFKKESKSGRVTVNGKINLTLLFNQALLHEEVWGNGGIGPWTLDLKEVARTCRFNP